MDPQAMVSPEDVAKAMRTHTNTKVWHVADTWGADGMARFWCCPSPSQPFGVYELHQDQVCAILHNVAHQ